MQKITEGGEFFYESIVDMQYDIGFNKEGENWQGLKWWRKLHKNKYNWYTKKGEKNWIM